MRFGTARPAPLPPPISSRLLPLVVGEERLARLDRVRVLDFGRLSRLTLDYFSAYRCRMQVVDAGHTLAELSSTEAGSLASGPAGSGGVLSEEHDQRAHIARILDALFGDLGYQRFDVVLLWDTINLLPDAVLAPFFMRLREHLHDGFAGHGFMLHRREPRAGLRHLGIVDQDSLQWLNEQTMPLHLHNRKQLNESVRPLQVKHGVLHGDGRLEFVFAQAA